jgi:hypothetical protein
MARWLLLCTCLVSALVFGYRDAVRSKDAKTLGGVCDSTFDCKQGTTCASDGVMEGLCSAACSSSAACSEAFGSAAQCIAADLCARSCRSGSDCLEGTVCNTYGWCERVSAR